MRAHEDRPAVLVEGFPHGHFTKKTLSLARDLVAVDPEPLEAWIVTSRILSSFERATGLPEKRILR